MKKRTCKLCGTELRDTKRHMRRGALFCCDEHKTKYHNENLSIDRTYNRAKKALNDLSGMRDTLAITNRAKASELLHKLSFDAVILKRSAWICVGCGDFTHNDKLPKSCRKCELRTFIAVKADF